MPSHYAKYAIEVAIFNLPNVAITIHIIQMGKLSHRGTSLSRNPKHLQNPIFWP